MDSLTSTHPLDGVVPLSGRNFTARALGDRKVMELRGKPSGVLLPTQPNTSAIAHGVWRAAWLRPNGWLLTADAPATPGRELLEGTCRLTDLSHSRACVALHGDAVPEVLSKGTPLDLRPDRFSQDRCARTWCAGFTVLLDHVATGIDVYVDTSLAIAFWEWLSDATLELRDS